MRKLLALLPIVAVVIVANALVASAGLSEAPAPSTIGYTIMLAERGAAEEPETEEPAAEGSTPTVAAEPSDGAVQVPDLTGNDVGALQGSCEAQLATVDLTTGAVAALPAGPSPEACAGDLTFAPDGTLYGLLRGEGEAEADFVSELVRFDTTTGAATVVGQITSFNSFSGFSEVPIGGLAFDAQGQLFAAVIMAAESPNPDPACLGADVVAVCLYRVDPANPEAAALVGPSASGPTEELVFEVSTLNGSCSTMYSSSIDVAEEDPEDAIVTVDTTTGALTDLGVLRPRHFIAGQATDGAQTLWALELVAIEEGEISYALATLDPAGGTPIDTEIRPVTLPPGIEIAFLNGLAIEPLDCAQPEPLVLAPTFTG